MALSIFFHTNVFSAVTDDLSFDCAKGVHFLSTRLVLTRDGAAQYLLPARPTKPTTQAVLRYTETSIKDSSPEKLLIEGIDRRKPVTTTAEFPWSLHGQMTMRKGRETYGGSGILVGPCHFLTAAHCVHDGGYLSDISIRMGLNDEVAPFGEVKAVRIYLYKQWIESKDPEFDLALVVLNKEIGHQTGWAGLLCLEDEELKGHGVHVTGYPGDKGFKTMWTMENTLARISTRQLYYDIDTFGGQSGGAIWINKWGMPHVVGNHAYGGVLANGGNYGVRLDPQKINNICEWLSETWALDPKSTFEFTVVSTIGRALPDERLAEPRETVSGTSKLFEMGTSVASSLWGGVSRLWRGEPEFPVLEKFQEARNAQMRGDTNSAVLLYRSIVNSKTESRVFSNVYDLNDISSEKNREAQKKAKAIILSYFKLARLLEDGRFAPEEKREAVDLYRSILDKTHHPYTAYRLAKIYEEGRIVEKSEREAVKFYRKIFDRDWVLSGTEISKIEKLEKSDGGFFSYKYLEEAHDFLLKSGDRNALRTQKEIERANKERRFKKLAGETVEGGALLWGFRSLLSAAFSAFESGRDIEASDLRCVPKTQRDEVAAHLKRVYDSL